MSYDDLYTQTLTGATNAYSPTIQAPVDGYRAFVNSVNTGLQTLISNDAYVHYGIERLPGQSSTVHYRFSANIGSGTAAAGWQPISTTVLPTTQRTSSTSGHTNPVWLQLPDMPTCYIKRMGYIAACPLATEVPILDLPKMELWKRPAYDALNTEMTLVAQVDVVPTLANYKLPHLVALNEVNYGSTAGDDYHFAIYGDPNVSGYIVYKAWVEVLRL